MSVIDKLLMFFGPLMLTGLADLVIDRLLSKIGWRRVLWACLENGWAVAAFYLSLGQLFELGFRGLAIAQIAALPKLILSAAFFGQSRDENIAAALLLPLC